MAHGSDCWCIHQQLVYTLGLMSIVAESVGSSRFTPLSLIMTIGRVLIGGGTGFIGRALRSVLLKKGRPCCVVSRMPAPDSITWEELAISGIPKDVTGVVNFSGQNVLDPLRRWTPGFQQNVISSRVETNRMLSSAIQNRQPHSVNVFITISGVGFYPPHPSKQYDEYSEGGDHDFLSRLCCQWENACKQTKNVRTVIVRSGIVLGPGGGIIKEMYPLFYFGMGAKIGSGNQYMPWIHIDDLIGLLVRALENDHFDGVINAVAPQHITNGQFTKAFGKALWRPTWLTLPEQLIELVFSKDRAVMMTQGQRVLCARAAELGHQFKFADIDSALKDIVTKR